MNMLRFHLGGFIVLLLLSGISAFPLQTEIMFLYTHLGGLPETLQKWISGLFTFICIISSEK
jgi:hypothetical protein